MNGQTKYGSSQAWWAAAVHAWDRYQFASRRADYYDYLSCLLQGMRGRRSLKEVFQLDAARYGLSSFRGRLSGRWLQRYQLAGGDLYSTWLDEFPVAELGLIRMAQSFGNAALVNTLSELSQVLQLTRKAGQILLATLWAAVAGLLVSLALMVAVSWFTVPHLLQAFASVPPEFYGALTRNLMAVSAFIRATLPLLLALMVGCWGLLLWSLPNTYGWARKRLEPYGLWRIYRYVQALRFLALLALVLGRDDSNTTQLRSALIMQKTGASRWQASHIDTMLRHIDSGLTGAGTFDTGLLDRDHFWFLSDMVMARGLHDGLALTRDRIRSLVLGSVARQAAALRWAVLLTCLGFVLGMGLWHYAVIDELRHSLMLFHAGG